MGRNGSHLIETVAHIDQELGAVAAVADIVACLAHHVGVIRSPADVAHGGPGFLQVLKLGSTYSARLRAATVVRVTHYAFLPARSPPAQP
jgi:hypothetical protein